MALYVLQSMVILSLFLTLLVLITGEFVSDTQSVLDTVFAPSKYNKMIRGVKDQTKAVSVDLSFSLTSIVNLDELKEVFETMGLLSIKWRDERLVWDPDDYNGTRAVHVFQNEVWKPEILLSNPSKAVTLLGHERGMIAHFFDGNASWVVGDLFRSQCALDVSSFPWDTQTCFVDFLVWGYSKAEVTLQVSTNAADLSYFHGNGAWELMSTSATLSDTPSISRVSYSFELRRYAGYPVVNIIVPILTLTVLNILAAFIPVASGERLSYCMTVLLALAVFLSLVSGHLPKNSNNMAKLCLLLMCILIMSTIICTGSVLSVYLYCQPEESSPPAWMLRLLGMFFRRKCSPKVTQAEGFDVCNDHASKQTQPNDEHKEVISEKKNSPTKDQYGTGFTWKDASKCVDRIFCYTSIGWLLVSIVIFLAAVLHTTFNST